MHDGFRRTLLAAVIVSGAVLVASGLWLTVNYRPNQSILSDGSPRPLGLARTTHLWTTWVFLAGAAGLAVGDLRRRRLPAAGVVAAAVAGVATGLRLPWDALGLRFVRAGSDFRGVLRAAFDESAVRFVLIGGAELTQDDYRVRVLGHLAVALLAAVLVAAVAAYPRLERPRAPGT
ncbi:MAG: hypothetical protein ACLGI2_09940 [Acidimicrobiia bacterium]